jgi:hypothetical protein
MFLTDNDIKKIRIAREILKDGYRSPMELAQERVTLIWRYMRGLRDRRKVKRY